MDGTGFGVALALAGWIAHEYQNPCHACGFEQACVCHLTILLKYTDANATPDVTYDVVAITDGTGAVVERILYDPYGKSTVLDPNFAFDSDSLSDYDWETLLTSREFNMETGLDYFRARYYHNGVGRFVGRDPLEYPDGYNLYAGYFVPWGVDPNEKKWWSWIPGVYTYFHYYGSPPGESPKDNSVSPPTIQQCCDPENRDIAETNCKNSVNAQYIHYMSEYLETSLPADAVEITTGIIIGVISRKIGGRAVIGGTLTGGILTVDGIIDASCTITHSRSFARAAASAKKKCECP